MPVFIAAAFTVARGGSYPSAHPRGNGQTNGAGDGPSLSLKGKKP